LNFTLPFPRALLTCKMQNTETLFFLEIYTYTCLLLVTSASDLQMRTIKFCSVIFGVTSRLPVVNKIHWRVVLCRPFLRGCDQCRCLMLPAMNVINLPWSGGTLFRTSDGRAVENTPWSEILVENSYPTCIRRPCFESPRQNIAIRFGMQKLE